MSVGKTYEQIRKLLLAHGSRNIAPVDQAAPDGTVVNVRLLFDLPSPAGGMIGFEIDAPIIYPSDNPTQRQRDQAQRTAFRQLYYWLEANFTLADEGFVDPIRVLMAWIRQPASAGGGTVGDQVEEELRQGRLPYVPALLEKNEVTE